MFVDFKKSSPLFLIKKKARKTYKKRNICFFIVFYELFIAIFNLSNQKNLTVKILFFQIHCLF